MKIITCCKVVPDEEQIKVLPNRELALDDVPAKISQYDLNALEAAKKLSAETKGSVTALMQQRSVKISFPVVQMI